MHSKLKYDNTMDLAYLEVVHILLFQYFRKVVNEVEAKGIFGIDFLKKGKKIQLK